MNSRDRNARECWWSNSLTIKDRRWIPGNDLHRIPSVPSLDDLSWYQRLTTTLKLTQIFFGIEWKLRRELGITKGEDSNTTIQEQLQTSQLTMSIKAIASKCRDFWVTFLCVVKVSLFVNNLPTQVRTIKNSPSLSQPHPSQGDQGFDEG